MKFFYIVLLNFFVIAQNQLCMRAADAQEPVTLNSAANTTKKFLKYYSLPMHLRQHIADFAGLNSPNKQGWLPLQVASAKGDLKKSLFLLYHGANPNIMNAMHPTSPLCFTASYNYSICSSGEKERYHKTLRHLLYHGANPYAVDEFGQTAVHEAVLSENVPALQKIIKIGVDINVTNKDGQTPYDVAKKLAMNPKKDIDSRRSMGQICTIFKKAGAQSSLVLEPVETNQVAADQFDWASKHTK